MEQEHITEIHLSASALQVLRLGMVLAIAVGFLTGVYWPY
jgi:hypothetical protein